MPMPGERWTQYRRQYSKWHGCGSREVSSLSRHQCDWESRCVECDEGPRDHGDR